MPAGTQCVLEGGGRDFRSLHFTYLLDGCLYDDDLPIANLEPGVSGRNSLPLSGTFELSLVRASRFLMPFNLCIEFYIDFKVDFGPYFGQNFAYFSTICLINFQGPFLE